MFETIGVPELLIILVIVVLLFGAGRVGRLGKDLGTSVKEFRRAMSDDDGAPTTSSTTVEVSPIAQIAAPPSVEAAAPAASTAQTAAGPNIF